MLRCDELGMRNPYAHCRADDARAAHVHVLLIIGAVVLACTALVKGKERPQACAAVCSEAICSER